VAFLQYDMEADRVIRDEKGLCVEAPLGKSVSLAKELDQMLAFARFRVLSCQALVNQKALSGPIVYTY